MQISRAVEENEDREFDDGTMTTLSDNYDNYENEDSEDDEAFLAWFDNDENCIG